MMIGMVGYGLKLVVVFFIHENLLFVVGQENSCELPKKRGTCNARIERWFFNIRIGKCRKFIYSGCNGNPNNFLTKEDCNTACNARVCRLPKNEGQCSASRLKWYYDINDMECKQFTYTGCRGNRNRFGSLNKCRRRCNKVVKDACPPQTPCRRPQPDECAGLAYIFKNGVRCAFGCIYPPCKPGNCPGGQPASSCIVCELNRDCDGSQICCEGCCRIPVIDPKRGKCPTTGLRKCIGTSSECSLDSQCTGKMKCCSIGELKCCVDPKDSV